MAKVMISLPDEMLERIDEAAGRLQMSRSAFLRQAIRPHLPPDPAARRAAAERLRSRPLKLGATDSARLVREQRDELDARDRRRAGLE